MLVEVASEYAGFVVSGFAVGMAVSAGGVLLRAIRRVFRESLSDGKGSS